MREFHWSRPVRNGRIARRQPWEPPIWLAVPLLAGLGWLFMIVMLSF